jgi:hypothetical protein
MLWEKCVWEQCSWPLKVHVKRRLYFGIEMTLRDDRALLQRITITIDFKCEISHSRRAETLIVHHV